MGEVKKAEGKTKIRPKSAGMGTGLKAPETFGKPVFKLGGSGSIQGLDQWRNETNRHHRETLRKAVFFGLRMKRRRIIRDNKSPSFRCRT